MQRRCRPRRRARVGNAVQDAFPHEAPPRAYARACDALDTASDDAEVLRLSDLKALAGLNARKALVAAGWTAPTRERSVLDSST